jgi:hypothetical protein
MKITLKVRAAKEEVTPEKLEKIHEYSPGYAKKVREQVRAAKKIDPSSRWGWCIAEVVAVVEIEGVKLKGRASMGGCSYTSELDFVKNSGYFDDMVKEAISQAFEQFSGAMAKALGQTLQQFAG